MRQLREGVWLLELGYRAPLDANAYLIDDRIGPGAGAVGDAACATAGDGAPDGDGGDGGDSGIDSRHGEGLADATGGEDDPADESAGAGVTLVDTGIRYNRRSLRQELQAAGYEAADVDRVLLTHYDLDHTGGLDRVPFDCPVYLGERDVWMVRGEWDPPVTHHKGLWHRAVRRLFPVPSHIDLRPVRDGDRIGRFRAFHTPGHNPGHTSYVHDSGVAFVGDLLWETDGDLTTPFWADSYDMRRLRRSVVQFADRSDEFELVCMGHGEPFTANGSDRVRALANEFERDTYASTGHADG